MSQEPPLDWTGSIEVSATDGSFLLRASQQAHTRDGLLHALMTEAGKPPLPVITPPQFVRATSAHGDPMYACRRCGAVEHATPYLAGPIGVETEAQAVSARHRNGCGAKLAPGEYPIMEPLYRKDDGS